MDLAEVKRYLENLNQENILFDSHFYKRSAERPLNEGMARSFLSKPEKLEKIEYGKEKEQRFKLWFKMSRKYSLVLIVEIHLPKSLKVISCWNTDRKWQGKLQR